MGWQFDELQSGNIEGWNHAGLAQFRAGALSNLVRETLQNSLDNPDPENGDEVPIIVRFIEHNVERSDIPGIHSLSKEIQDCVQQVESGNEEARKGVKAALDISRRPEIKVLEIADYHTTGMPGPAVRRKPFHNYLKTSGDSTPDASRGGSHGLGKFAPLANTELRTIFVSTKWEENGEEHTLFQGLTFLLGREIAGSTASLVQKGYFGGADFEPLSEVPEQFSWMRRDAVGTSIFLLGWNSSEQWDISIIGHALINFFAAFQRNKLIISVKKTNGREITVGENSDFRTLFDNPKIKRVLDESTHGYGEQFEYSKLYLKCLEDENATHHESKIYPGINASRVSLIKDEDGPQRIAFVRNNILITDRIPTFYGRRNQQFDNYAGVFEVTNKKGQQLLRRMENPSHTKLDENWLPAVEKQDGLKALKAVGEKLKAIVKENMSIGGNIDGGPVEILKEFFSDAAGEGAENIENEDINPDGKFKITSKPPKFAPPPVITITDQEQIEDENIEDENSDGNEGGAGTQEGNGGDGNGHGPGDGEGTGGTGNRGDKDHGKNMDTMKLSNKRVINIDKNVVTARLTSPTSGQAKIKLQEVGADFSEELKITGCNLGAVENGTVSITLEAGVSAHVELKCENEIVGGVKLLVRGE